MLRTDKGVSDVIGNIILLGITVILVVAAGAQIIQAGTSVPRAVPQIAVGASVAPGLAVVTLVHEGGPSVDRGDLRVRVSLNATPVFDATLGLPGVAWALGETISIGPLPSVPGAGSVVDVQLVSITRGAPVATTGVSVGGASGAPLPGGAGPGLEVGIVLVSQGAAPNGTYAVVSPPTRLQVYAKVTHPFGRKEIARVTVDLTPLSASATTSMMDLGTGGDVVAGDGNYTTIVLVPPTATPGLHVLRVTATDIDGRTDTGTVTLSVTGQFYNKLLLNKTVHRLIEYPGPSSGDKLTLTLKIKLVDQPANFSDGTSYHVDAAEFRYDPPKPTDTGVVSLARLCTSNDNRIIVFQAQNVTIPQYARERDDIRYYLSTKWLDAANKNPFYSGVEAHSQYQFFLYRNVDTFQVVKDDAWPTSFTDCND